MQSPGGEELISMSVKCHDTRIPQCSGLGCFAIDAGDQQESIRCVRVSAGLTLGTTARAP
ncbi:hypothetical protein HYE67_005097 [Fusarium culmorum]|uniref:Uncharacterized protein n=1 Tax=Fusarium culmorum TaxID=5516 RepID=A0A7S8D6H6_FUSCU|nr:hypothetical protein HYE67_005097 [Fusarium culmorum]